MKFRTMYNNNEELPESPAGDKYRYIYDVLEPYQANENGEVINMSKYQKKVKSNRKYDIQEQIDSFKESTELKNILKNMAAQAPTIYCDENMEVFDATELPRTMGQVKEAQALLAQITPQVEELKAKYEEAAKQQQANNLNNLTADEIIKIRSLLEGGSNK